MKSYKQHFSRFLGSRPKRLHVAAHSHHLWPDCTFDAHQEAWSLAAEHVDDKWGPIFDTILPEARRHIARTLSLPDASTISFAPNTHEMVLRLRSCLGARCRILTTDSEFHSFTRQSLRWQEAGLVELEIVPTEPFADFGHRFVEAVRSGEHHWIYLSQVFFNSGLVFDDLDGLAQALAESPALLTVDGYHGFMALPTDLSRVADRCFYLAGGYKYAMSGEGACFMHCPPGYGQRPVDTGWFAGFGQLEQGVDRVGFGQDGSRFAGATFDVSGILRFNAVMRWLDAEGITVVDVHNRVRTLQEQFLVELDSARIDLGELVPGRDAPARGHFLTFRSPAASRIHSALAAHEVVVDCRADRLRFGFGLYHDPDDVDELVRRLRAAKVQAS